MEYQNINPLVVLQNNLLEAMQVTVRDDGAGRVSLSAVASAKEETRPARYPPEVANGIEMSREMLPD